MCFHVSAAQVVLVNSCIILKTMMLLLFYYFRSGLSTVKVPCAFEVHRRLFFFFPSDVPGAQDERLFVCLFVMEQSCAVLEIFRLCFWLSCSGLGLPQIECMLSQASIVEFRSPPWRPAVDLCHFFFCGPIYCKHG